MSPDPAPSVTGGELVSVRPESLRELSTALGDRSTVLDRLRSDAIGALNRLPAGAFGAVEEATEAEAAYRRFVDRAGTDLDEARADLASLSQTLTLAAEEFRAQDATSAGAHGAVERMLQTHSK